MNHQPAFRSRSKIQVIQGFSLIEVMITMFILAIGLLGLAGLQARAISAEYESYSRGQALFMVDALVSRMAANTTEVKATTTANTSYNQGNGTGDVATAPTLRTFGNGSLETCTTTTCCGTSAADVNSDGTVSRSETDLCEWHVMLRDGVNSSSSLGAMPSIRGCVFLRDSTTREYQVDVVWQGRDVGASAPAGVTCGSANITTRRVGVSRRIRFADLSGA